MFEQQLERGLFSSSSEKTFVDKVLGKNDVDRIREVISKNKLKREDLLEVLYLLSSTESKLLNLGEWDRYVILKFFVWIREFVKVAELLYDYKDELERKETHCSLCGRRGHIAEKLPKLNEKIDYTDLCRCQKPRFLVLSARSKKLIDNCENLIEHNAKFLIDLYFNICRSTLSLGATGFLELIRNKYEINYSGNSPFPQPVQEEKKKIFSLRR